MPNSTIPPRRNSRRERRKKNRVWPWVLLVLCFIAAAAAGALFASNSLLDRNGSLAEDGLMTAKDKSTIMIMGVDTREDDVGRSDTLMLATIDPKKDQAALLSIPRDTRVKIKGHGFDKINAAYAYGGERLTQSTVENFLGVNVDHYIVINTHAFQKIIDALGGIDINVEKRMYYEDPWDDDGGLLIDLQPGMQHMDGKTAVTYVRYRDQEGDIGRIKRQQKFVAACMDKLTSPSIIPKLPAVIREVINSVKTDLSVRQLLEFAGTLKESRKNGLKTDMVPGKPLYINGVSYWIPDIAELRATLANTLGLHLSGRAQQEMERAQQEYRDSIPSTAKEVPASDTSIGKASKSSHKESGLKESSKKESSQSSNSSRSYDRRSEDTAASRSERGEDVSVNAGGSAPSRTGNSGKGQ